MKTNELTTSMTFSHRPQDGISVGFATVGGVAYMAVGFVRKGDFFNRKLARRILAQRITSSIERNAMVQMVAAHALANPKVDARAIVREFRKSFKPDPTCQDNTFSTLYTWGEAEIVAREPLSRDAAFAKIVDMFGLAVSVAGAVQTA